MNAEQAGKLEELEARVEALRQGFLGEHVVTASRIAVLGPDGTPRAELGPNRQGAMALELRNEGGQTQAVLGVHPSGSPFLLLLGTEGKPRLGAHLEPDGSPLLMLMGSDMSPRIRITEKDGGSQVSLLDAKGTVRATISVLPNGVPGILTFDENGELIR